MTNYKTLAQNVSYNKATGIITKLGYEVLKTEIDKNDTIMITRHHEIRYNEITGDLKIRELELVKVC